jgi:hypothetical protein
MRWVLTYIIRKIYLLYCRIYEDPELRPDICKELDPDNPNCQVLGRYCAVCTLTLHNIAGP